MRFVAKQKLLKVMVINNSNTMTRHSCARCGYETELKHNLVRHLTTKKECRAHVADIPRCHLLKQLERKENSALTCDWCQAVFGSRSSKSRHKKHCPRKPGGCNADTSDGEDEEKTKLKSDLEKMQSRIQTLESSLAEKHKLEIELAFHKNKRSEAFYQKLLEAHHQGSHCKTRCGVTDITTETMHAELKRWDCWKEALGQILSYQHAKNKEELRVYLFGKYTERCKQTAAEVFQSFNVSVYDCVDSDDGVDIVRYDTQEPVFTFRAAAT